MILRIFIKKGIILYFLLEYYNEEYGIYQDNSISSIIYAVISHCIIKEIDKLNIIMIRIYSNDILIIIEYKNKSDYIKDKDKDSLYSFFKMNKLQKDN